MRLDHIAYRVKNRIKTKNWICKAFGYVVADKFTIKLEDGSKAKCYALKCPNGSYPKTVYLHDPYPWDTSTWFHKPPEIFISDGPKGSLIDKWVDEWGRGVGAIHHLAYEVEDVAALMKDWKKKGLAKFLTDKPLVCDDGSLKQIFTTPCSHTGIIYEFIERSDKGFCKENVGKLMDSTKDL